jgi:asparagine synthase (glutamine-hydrolysing)
VASLTRKTLKKNMCGIFSLLNIDSRFSQEFVHKQFMKGNGRGPEHSILQNIGSNVVFGFHRLAINGLNAESNQPIVHGNVILICNGEIYNYRELYLELGIEPFCESDCEVIIHLYERFGIERTLQLLDGVFAFILLDYEIQTIYVCRDPFGVRPLYVLYSTKEREENVFYGFASEMKCLSEFYKDQSDYYEIKHVQPGTYTTFSNSSCWKYKSEKRYHVPSVIATNYKNENKINYNTEVEYWTPIIQSKLIEAVNKRCLATERPIACLLSGGLDSSLITALVNDFHVRHHLPTLETYSIGLKDSEDLKFARIAAEYLKTKHTEVVLQESEFLNAIPEVIEKIESYDTTSVRASIGNYLLGKYIKANSNAKVIFNGDGSDELTGGYLYFHKAPNALEFDLECRRLLEDIHLYDVLRSDKSISTHGLEPRTPFLDREWVQTYLTIPSEVRFHAKQKVCEKHLLRTAFSQCLDVNDRVLLPDEILWRTKEAFSDGVSQKSRSLYEIIQEHVSTIYISKDIQYLHLPPQKLEQEYYRDIFEFHYKGLGELVPYFWMPKFIEGVTDASARTLNIYNCSQNEK